MRDYPHQPSEKVLVRNREAFLEIFKPDGAPVGSPAATEPEPFWTGNAENGRFCAAYLYALEAPLEAVRYYLGLSNASFSTGMVRRAPFDLDAVMQQLASAVIVKDADLATKLCTLPAERYQIDDVEFLPSTTREFDVWKAIVLGSRDAAAQSLQRAVTGLAADRIPRAFHDDSETMIALMNAVLTGDAAALDVALARRAKIIASNFKSPSLRQNPASLLDLRGLAIVAIGIRMGVVPTAGSVYHPLDLVVK